MQLQSIIKPRNVTIKDFQEITVAIDSLDDIFSDFDPRPLTQRALSEDFLKEIKKFYRETATDKLIVNFLGPIELKAILEKNQLDKAIVSHLTQDFRRRAQANKKSIRAIWRTGVIYIIFGMAFLLMLTLLGYKGVLDKLSLEILSIIFMPLGWFGVWEGFSKLVDTPFKLKEETEMNSKLAKAQYKFLYLAENKPDPKPRLEIKSHPIEPKSRGSIVLPPFSSKPVKPL